MVPTTRISVLGPVRAWRDDREVDLGAPQQRAVLALIALAGGDPVPTPTLVEALWATDPPRTAVNVVHTYLKRLRCQLDPHRPARRTSELLPSVGGGYALRATPEVVDLWRFRALVVAARRARRAGDHRQVVASLTRALELWKGPPASGAPITGLPARLAAVADERWSAVSWLAEAALACGRAEEVLGVVTDAAAAQPHHEPLHAHLVRIYHRIGRRADAVQVFHQARRRLHDELGFAPGPELTAAYRAMLRDERARLTVGLTS